MKAFKAYFAPGKDRQEEIDLSGRAGQSEKPTQINQPESEKDHRRQPRPQHDAPLDNTSLYTPGIKTPSVRSASSHALDLRTEVVVHSLWQNQLRRLHISNFTPYEGVVLKKSRGDYACAPSELKQCRGGLYDMMSELNVNCAMTVNVPFVQIIVKSITVSNRMGTFPLRDGRELQVLPSFTDLPRCRKHHFAALTIEPPLLVVWDDDHKNITQRVRKLESDLIRSVWGKGDDDMDADENEKEGSDVQTYETDPWELEAAREEEKRPVRVASSIMVGLALALSITCLGLGWRLLTLQSTVDGDYKRFALIALAPFTVFISLFFFQSIVVNFFQMIGPVSSVQANSTNYSGKAPRRLNRSGNCGDLPHVTIQMPVYKEGLGPVIKPTVLSLKAAISTYEMQGGTANIFVNDDGMQLIPQDQAQARRDFYEEHNIGWVARPRHDPTGEASASGKPFLRRGRFKKASNMNYGLMVSNRIEKRLAEVVRTPGWGQEAEDQAYAQAQRQVLEEDEGRTWSEGNIRIGDYILLIDSDTRVPEDCFLDAVTEMDASPEVAILQYTSGVMTVTDSFFEKGVTWFTNMIYTVITFAVALGDIPPFVGHNAVLRWSAIQDGGSYMDEEDGYEKFWSESHVSEDFDMALRLQIAGYQLRFGSYPGDGFKEGVSLTVYDELARWEKYAYGVNELIFHPFRFWLLRGPITPLFRRFICSNIKMYRKLTILAYIGTYYAIGASWLLSLFNYFFTGWLDGQYDQFYLDSYTVYFSIIVVFPLFGNISLAVLRYRLKQKSLLGALIENFKWVPLFIVFLGGISLHVSKALLCHFFEVNINWGATSKEAESCDLLEEVPRIIKNFWGTFAFCFSMTALMICGVYAFPHDWRIVNFVNIYPLASSTVCHFALPVFLNPALMRFTF